ncbi:hypothetical protein [Micromonospora aurantiaca (nom. illeg.)]|uniref:hypothetical protein n=1 Tax=Micromonospora aurantiaca (nom. illeg.) TaxID=47850 RepID=UPI003F49C28F
MTWLALQLAPAGVGRRFTLVAELLPQRHHLAAAVRDRAARPTDDGPHDQQGRVKAGSGTTRSVLIRVQPAEPHRGVVW